MEHGTLRKGEKYCCELNYSVTRESPENITTIQFNLLMQVPSNGDPPPALNLTVYLKECPIGFEIMKGRCSCQDIMESYKIKCHNNYSLVIPPQIWIGSVMSSEDIAVQTDCHYCKNGWVNVVEFSRGDSNQLCISNRTGVMCGACTAKYSLQLGGYECARCSDSTYKGVLLLIAFAVIGIALVLLLLGLNLTVSTGMINGLIFYSNIVYLNSDTLLPITREGNSTHLQNTVRILSTFQAWINLDFGIVTCFFDGYDIYKSIWMQFVFPLYIWLLILIIVLANRYSSSISKITTTNIVPVLSTLMLLSYAKVLKSSFDAVSFTNANFILNGPAKHHIIWIPDENVLYLQGKHTPLFVMSLLIVLVYILPFTLLVLLGPLLQAKSHCRVFHWINKLKPFLDSFYGPYTSRYRYWPGILLLARLVVVSHFSFYSLGDSPYKLAAVSVAVVFLLALWMLLGRTRNTSLHQNQFLNFTELFFLVNLAIFSVSSIYNASIDKRTRQQQGFAVAMVGSVLLVFIGILAYQAFITASRFKVMRGFMNSIRASAQKRIKANFEESQNSAQKQKESSTNISHSLVELEECVEPNELREPLLTSKN